MYEDNEDEHRETYYECRGQTKVVKSSFIYDKPWIIPLGIAKIPVTRLTKLPREIAINGQKYTLGEFSLHSPGHFTGVIKWDNHLYYYDGLPSTPEQTLLSLLHNVSTIQLHKKKSY